MSDATSQGKDRPAFQFYPADWRKDVELRSCSLAARGLWIDLMCVMHECRPYGFLVLNGKPMTAGQIVNQIGGSEAQVKKLLRELLDAGVAKRAEDGSIYSKRMVNDERIRNARAAGGKGGAEHGIKGAEHGAKGGRPKADKGGSETPLQGAGNPPPSSSSSSSVDTVEVLPPTSGAGEIPDTTGLTPTPAGAICRALRQAGIADTNPGHPRLQTLIAAGATEAEFTGFAKAAIDKSAGFLWILGAVEGERKRAQQQAAQLHQGAMPQRQAAPADPRDARAATPDVDATARMLAERAAQPVAKPSAATLKALRDVLPRTTP